MKSLDNKILKLLSNNDVTFFIPPYQRNYEWGEEICEILYNDIEKVADSENTQHFFGTIIYYSESTILGLPDKYILVDGQQRLTTIMLFLIAVKDAITDDQLKNFIDFKYLKNDNVSGDVEYKIKLKQVESDWKAYKSIILGEPLDNVDKKSNVFKNYKFFKSKLERLEQNKLKNLVIKGLTNFNIVTIELEPEQNHWENPQEIFESMNSLGKPLSLADLVRNYLLLGKSSEQQNKLYHNFWLKIEQNLSGDNNAFSVSAFIRDYMQLIEVASFKKATETNYKNLYREFKDLFGYEDHEELIKKLAKYSTDYAILAGYRSSSNKEIDQKSADLKIIESSSFYSFILGLLHLRTEGEIDDNGCLDILNAIFIYIFRRRILRITGSENKDAPLLVKYFNNLISAENKKEKMLKLLSEQPYALRLPNDNDIKSYLLSIESNFYNLRSGKFLLSLLEEDLSRSRPNLGDKRLQVEHIMPQTLNDEWKSELGENYLQIHDDYVNNIGNLTLIRHNQELGRKPFIDKKEVYANNAGMQIAKDKIIDQHNWGEEQIKNRAKYLVEMIINNILPISEELKKNSNYSLEKHHSRSRFSFKKIDLIGKTIVYFDDDSITAKVISDRKVKFEDKNWMLSPLTREIEKRKNRCNSSGAYRGSIKWKYKDKILVDWMKGVAGESEDNENNQNEE